jgi:hypothetical protein
MSPLWGVFLLIVLVAIWVIVEEAQKAGRELSRALPPPTVRDVVLLAVVGLWAALRSVVLLITPGPQSVLPVAAHWAVAAMALLAALYRSRQS